MGKDHNEGVVKKQLLMKNQQEKQYEDLRVDMFDIDNRSGHILFTRNSNGCGDVVCCTCEWSLI